MRITWSINDGDIGGWCDTGTYTISHSRKEPGDPPVHKYVVWHRDRYYADESYDGEEVDCVEHLAIALNVAENHAKSQQPKSK